MHDPIVPEGAVADASARPTGGVQPQLPLDEPVPYALTARARLLVADQALPALRVVAGGGQDDRGPRDLDAPDDTRRVRARALHRAGLPVAQIAAELDADPLHVEVWVDGLAAVPGGLRMVQRHAPAPTSAASGPGAGDHAAASAARRAAWDRAVDEGVEEAAARLREEPGLRAGLGLLGGVLREDRHAVVLDGTDAELVVAAWAWLRTSLGVPADTARLLVRHAPSDAGDRHAHRLASRTGMPLPSVGTSRDPAVPPGAPHLRVRVPDPALAGRAAGWRRLLLAELTGHPAAGPHGVVDGG